MKMHRNYVSDSLEVVDWDSVKYYFDELLNREINSAEELKKWLKDKSELESVLNEEHGWRYIKMSCDTQNEKLAKDFEVFVTQIEPKIVELDFELNKKLDKSKFVDQFKGNGYGILFRQVRNKIDLFRQENIPIQAELQKEEQEYGRIASEMTINYGGEEITLHQANNFLKETDRNIREEVYRKIWQRRLKDSKTLDELLGSLVQKRQKIAQNAGFENFRDYMFRKLGRFDYEVEDCYKFHEAIKNEVVPLVNKLQLKRKESLDLVSLKPWDLDVNENLLDPLRPFSNVSELISKTISSFNQVKPKYAEYIRIMEKGGFLDLESRKGKAPGGYNYPLYESNIPFIFMNATGNLLDVETMVHEGGHAIHSFLTKDLELVAFKELPSEIAELASMSMELISMEHWESFFENPEDLFRAKLNQLKGVVEMLPWVAMIDKFQHQIYQRKDLTASDVKKDWQSVSSEFIGNIVDWKGLEEIGNYTWQKQLHIFEVPFYYIEYGFAQLGAIAIWRNYRKNPEKALQDYENALKLGYSKTIPEIYKTAGIEFNFSKEYIKELMSFISQEIEILING